VAAIVGVQIHHHKTEPAAEKDEVARVVLVFRRCAEKTPLVFIFFCFGD
jgi:hypothetical protein